MRVFPALAVAIAGLMLVACQAASVEPMLVRGTVVDESGAGVAGTKVVLDAFDAGGVPGGPVHFSATTITAPNGTFEFRVAPSGELLTLAADNRGMIGFGLGAQIRPDSYGRGDFIRGINGATWAGEPPTVTVQAPVVAP